MLLEAWRSAGLPERSAVLILAGGGPIRARAAATGIRPVGAQSPSELRNFYAGSDVVVVPSIPTRDFLEPWAFSRLNVVERILLSQRLEGIDASVARHVRDLVDLKPTDLEQTDVWFTTALAGKALQFKAGVGEDIALARERARKSPPTPAARFARPDPSAKPAPLRRSLHDQPKLFPVDRLGHKAEGPFAHRPRGALLGAERHEENELARGVVISQRGKQRTGIGFLELHHDDVMNRNLVYRGGGCAVTPDLNPIPLQAGLGQPKECGVLEDEQSPCHRRSPHRV